MDERELKEYIDGAEQRLNIALAASEKRINISVSSSESRFKEQMSEIDKCVKTLKGEVAKVKNIQLTCEGHQKISTLRIAFDSHIDKHALIKEVKVESKKSEIQDKRIGLTKWQLIAFIFFSTLLASLSGLTLYFHLSNTMVKGGIQ